MSNLVVFDKQQGLNVSDRYKAVNTAQLVSNFQEAGYIVSQIKTAKVQNVAKQGFQKHLIRLRHPGLIVDALSGLTPEIVVSNSYDGTSAFRLMMGIFRVVCENGLIVGNTFESCRVVHTGNAIEKVLLAAKNIQSQTEKIGGTISKWSQIEMSDVEILSFAKKASEILLPTQNDTNLVSLVRPESLLKVRRSADLGRDLWTVFNRIQENAINGGLSYSNVNASGQLSHRTARRVQSIDRTISINRKLWDIASQVETGA